MKKLILTLAAVAVSVSYATAADPAKKPAAPGAAGEKKHDPAEMFKKLDTNADGSISLEEFKAGPAGKKDPAKAEELFKKRDTNGDGKLSMDEMTAKHMGGKAGTATTPATATPDKSATPAVPEPPK